ncbi:MAG: radical SAM protein [Desulfobacterales bacterium]
MKPDTPHILLINPWIHDFAAYDFWAKPLGILSLASILRSHGFNISYIDCLDRFHPQASPTDPYARFGRGPYLKTRIPKPYGLADIPRHFSRYGIRKAWLKEDLLSIGPPDIILMTSMMTYWYPGVQETIALVREIFPNTAIVLGGIYATLCREHALRHSGADWIETGAGEKNILKRVGTHTGYAVSSTFDPDDLDAYPYPAFDLQRKISCVPLMTSKGCPFSCQYCASHFLNPKRMTRSPESVVEEIKYWHERFGVEDFIFYDDALLVDAQKHAVPMLEAIVDSGLNIRFHTPNAVHIRGISKQTAQLMFRAGFKTLRLGLETAAFDFREELDGKVTGQEFKQAVGWLREAGFQQEMVGAYLLAGLPGQKPHDIESSIRIVRQTGAMPILAYYTPIPHTKLWPKAVVSSRYDLESDPVFTNNAILPCQKEPFSWEMISHLKGLAKI